MKEYNSNLWGIIDEPESFVELVSCITNDESVGIDVYYWRGQAKIDWMLIPSIVRRIKLEERHQNFNEEKLDMSVSYWEELLLNNAKKQLYNYDELGRKLNDIELLAKLQHYGAATRLLDFSKNVLISLWFCVSAPSYCNDTGVLIGINTDVMSGMEDKFDFELNYSDFCAQLKNSNDICIVDSPAVVPRISAQNSVFLCSKSVDEKYGTFALPKMREHKKIIAISPKMKKICLKTLSECFNITPLTIYPDIEGFANANSVTRKITEFIRW